MKTHLTLALAAIVLVALSPASPHAAGMQRDWLWVVNALQSQGINANLIPWASVNQACMIAQPGTDAFAACQFEKAMDREQHMIDHEYCENEARGAIPKSLTQSFSSPHRGYGWGTRSYSLNYQELRSAREGYIHRCMAQMNWRSPDNYLLGKRHPSLHQAAIIAAPQPMPILQ